MLLPPHTLPACLNEGAAEAERKIACEPTLTGPPSRFSREAAKGRRLCAPLTGRNECAPASAPAPTEC